MKKITFLIITIILHLSGHAQDDAGTTQVYSKEVYRAKELHDMGVRQHMITLAVVVLCVVVYIVRMIIRLTKKEVVEAEPDKEE